MLAPHLPPQTAREALHVLCGDVHGWHSVVFVDWRNLGVHIACSCGHRPWFVDEERARALGMTLLELRNALKSAPRKPTLESRR